MAEETQQQAGSSEKLDGLTRAAVLAHVIGEEAAAEMLKHLAPKEVQALAIAIKDVGNLRQNQVESVVQDFLSSVGYHSSLGTDGEAYLRNVLVRAHGKSKADGIMDRITLGGEANGLENLKWMEAREVFEVIRDEHPQIKAIVLSYLDPEHAARVLPLFPEQVRADVILRIATLDSVQPAALKELDATLERQVAGSSGLQTTTVGGPKAAADLLNFVDGSVESEIIELVGEQDAEVSQSIQDLMFVFDNLIEVDDNGVQVLLREVSSESLLLAMKGTDNELKEKFFSNMSRRAAEMMRDDLEAKGPVRVSDVETAQKEILTIARRLSDDGQLSLGGQGGGGDFIE